MERSFFVTADALMKVDPHASADEAGLLHAFDVNRDRICAAAARVYARGPRGSYEVALPDF